MFGSAVCETLSGKIFKNHENILFRRKIDSLILGRTVKADCFCENDNMKAVLKNVS